MTTFQNGNAKEIEALLFKDVVTISNESAKKQLNVAAAELQKVMRMEKDLKALLATNERETKPKVEETKPKVE